MAVVPYFMHAAIALYLINLVTALDGGHCQYYPCTKTPCPKNHRLLRDSECDSMGPVACALNARMWGRPHGGFPYCNWCNWGEYSDSNNDNGFCTQCPKNTVVTQGRYSSRFNELVGNWCEEDCGVAFRQFLEYPIPGQDCDFCSDLFSPFLDSNIPCMTSGKRDKSGKTFIRKNQKCTDIDYKIADTLKVVWDDSSSELISRYSNPATIAELPYNNGRDIEVDVPDWGKGQRKCKPCDPGTYISKDKKKPKFQQITCKPCPKGFVSASITEKKLFLPQDVIDLTKEHVPHVVFPAASYELFGCRACPTSEGVGTANKNVCTDCQRNALTKQYEQYQHAEQVRTGTEFLFIVGTECRFCPPGYEYYNWKESSDKKPCRSTDGITDCCRICIPNSYSAGNGARCQPVAANVGTLTSFGAKEPKKCGAGEELVYCSTAGLCMTSSESRKIGWRTCRSCTLTETTRADGEGVCKECALEKMHFGDKKMQPPTVCKQCSSCEQMITTKTEEVLHTIATDEQTVASIKRWESLGEQVRMIDYKYTTEKVSATCRPLERRSIRSDTFANFDVYRPKSHTQDVELVPMFYTLVRTTGNCSLTRCADVCRTRFYYSPACGQQETDLTKIWVVHNGLLQQYKTLSPAQKQQDLYVEHGPCQMCQPCVKGEYNHMCNVHMNGVNPVGSCQRCLTECPAGFFMYHSEKEAACHVPSEIHKLANNLWQINENYVCQRCPTWVRDADKIYLVTACGITVKYTGWSWDDNSNLVPKEKDVSYSNWETDFAQLGDTYRNYRSFMRDLVPYCPVAYFYDEKVTGCNLEQQESQIFTVPGTAARIVSIGYTMYNPNCCKPCTTCSHFKKKDTSNWKPCMGDSIVNTQDFCVDRCGAMYWANETASECRRCSSCDSGFLAMS
jgi:hypothetical protein